MTSDGDWSEFSFENLDQSALESLAQDFFLALRPGDVIGLAGDLGAGKTTFVRAGLRALAGDKDLEVPSPTFSLIQEYHTAAGFLYHADLYRLESSADIHELALIELTNDAILVAEWFANAGDYWFEEAALLEIDPGEEPDTRTLKFSLPPDLNSRFERARLIRQFVEDALQTQVDRNFLQGDASARRYEIAEARDMQFVLMDAPAQPDGPSIKNGLAYSALVHLAEDVSAFTSVGAFLTSLDLSSASLLAVDYDNGLLLVEHLGTEGIAPGGDAQEERYERALECLAALHRSVIPDEIPVPLSTKRHSLPHFSSEAMQIEADLLIDWYLPPALSDEAREALRQSYHSLWEPLLARVQTHEKSLILRDYHSPNLLWLEDREGLQQVGMIDYQDAVIGPSSYDVASVIQDARLVISAPLQERLLTHYLKTRSSLDASFDISQFEEHYWIMAAQRAAKILGIFNRLNLRDGKDGYLKHLPQIETYMRQCLAQEILAPLRSWLETHTDLFDHG